MIGLVSTHMQRVQQIWRDHAPNAFAADDSWVRSLPFSPPRTGPRCSCHCLVSSLCNLLNIAIVGKISRFFNSLLGAPMGTLLIVCRRRRRPHDCGSRRCAGMYDGHATMQHAGHQTKKPVAICITTGYSFFWSGRKDSNLRPSGPKPDALPGCATPRQALHSSSALRVNPRAHVFHRLAYCVLPKRTSRDLASVMGLRRSAITFTPRCTAGRAAMASNHALRCG